MNLEIDLILAAIFIIGNVLLGLYCGRGVKTEKEYAIGNRDWSLSALVASIIACWVGGDELFVDLENIYSTGFHFVLASMGQVLGLILIAYIFIPRMGEFLGDLSMAESMGKLYGKRIRLITAITGSLAAIGLMAVQFKVFGMVFTEYFGVHPLMSVLLAGFIVISYSTIGGVRAVTITDIIQLFMFAAILIPILSAVTWNEYISINGFSFEASTKSPLFEISNYFRGEKFWPLFWLFLLFIMPGFHPALYQRVIMGRSVIQVQKAFYLSALILFIILAGVSFVGFLLFNLYPDIASNMLVYHIIENISHPGLKGLIIIGIASMSMSKADSNLNSAAILISHDILAPIGYESQNKLLLLKKISLLVGVLAIGIAYIEYDFLSMIMISLAFNVPMISPPLLLAILGFRTSERSVIIGILSSLVSVISYSYICETHIGDAIIPGMVTNFIFTISSHFLLKEQGGLVGIKENGYILQARQERMHKIKSWASFIKNFSFAAFFKPSILAGEKIYIIFGLASLLTSIASIYSSAGSDIIGKNILIFFYESMMFISVSFIAYSIWPSFLKKGKIFSAIWNFSLFYILIICSTFFAMLTNFSELQIVILAINLTAIVLLVRSGPALIMILFGTCITYNLYQYIVDVSISNRGMASFEQEISYIAIIFSAILFMFIRPREESEAITEERNDYLKEKISSQKQELSSLVNLKSEFLRNLNHELHTPVTGITSMAQGLRDNYKNMSEEEKYDCVKIIANSSEKFDKYTSSILHLAKLSSDNLELESKEVDLTEILYDSLERSLKLYPSQNLEIIKSIENNIALKGDARYLKLVFDNLIENALQYASIGQVKISLGKKSGKIFFSIEDQGIGIALDELYDIFSPFTVGSKTKSAANGKGIGLAICKKVIEAHNGKIWAESDGRTGSSFKFEMSLS